MGEVRCGGAEKEVGKVRYGVLRWKEGELSGRCACAARVLAVDLLQDQRQEASTPLHILRTVWFRKLNSGRAGMLFELARAQLFPASHQLRACEEGTRTGTAEPRRIMKGQGRSVPQFFTGFTGAGKRTRTSFTGTATAELLRLAAARIGNEERAVELDQGLLNFTLALLVH
eukprot:1741343-Rhodomonas_salina.1